MAFAFWNYVQIGADNDSFTDDTGAKTLTSGIYRFDAFIEHFLDTWSAADRRVALSSDGFLTLSRSPAANFSITWDDSALRNLLGYTADLSGTSSYIAPRLPRCCFVSQLATLADFDPTWQGRLEQTRSLGLVTRTTWMGRRRGQCMFELFGLNNASRLVSPTSAVATTYANAAATTLGLTEYTHARDIWSDCTSASSQGWSDGRPVVFFEDTGDMDFTMTASDSPAWASLIGSWSQAADASEWVFDEETCRTFGRAKVRAPKSHLYSLKLGAFEYVSP